MAAFSAEAWAAMGAVCAASVVGMLYVLATMARNERFVHEARIKVIMLRNRYAKQVEDAKEAATPDVIVLPDPVATADPAAGVQRRIAA